jgi:hypothetical protein
MVLVPRESFQVEGKDLERMLLDILLGVLRSMIRSGVGGHIPRCVEDGCVRGGELALWHVEGSSVDTSYNLVQRKPDRKNPLPNARRTAAMNAALLRLGAMEELMVGIVMAESGVDCPK